MTYSSSWSRGVIHRAAAGDLAAAFRQTKTSAQRGWLRKSCGLALAPYAPD